ncbi:hypothetical protein M1394_01245 [Candidatus Marsarchaeota archaeon]|nr:hypothetical protein [Candidatus Marsarchaeota archaeon]
MTTDELNFMDLACLIKITPSTVIEKLGSAMNASIFDASNIAGALKQKGMIEFTAYYPGPNTITITESGQNFLSEAEAKSKEEFDKLDENILVRLADGNRVPAELQNVLGLRPKDLALRLFKLNSQGFITYELKNGGVFLLLTEKGYLKANSAGVPRMLVQDRKPEAKAIGTEEQATLHPEAETQDILNDVSQLSRVRRSRKAFVVALGLLLLIIAILFLIFHFYHIL